MSIIKQSKKIELDSNSETITVNTSGVRSSVGSSLYVQVSDASDLTSLSLTGTMDKEEESLAIGAINLKDFSGVASITAAGLYLVPIDQLDTLTLTAVGEVTVIVKVIQN